MGLCLGSDVYVLQEAFLTGILSATELMTYFLSTGSMSTTPFFTQRLLSGKYGLQLPRLLRCSVHGEGISSCICTPHLASLLPARNPVPRTFSLNLFCLFAFCHWLISFPHKRCESLKYQLHFSYQFLFKIYLKPLLQVSQDSAAQIEDR